MALGEQMGKQAAHQLVEAACRRATAEGMHLREILSKDSTVMKHLTPVALDQLFDPQRYLGVADQFITRVLQAHRKAHSASTKERE